MTKYSKKSICSQDYTIKNNTLIFSDKFNGSLKPYYNVMKSYNTLKFSHTTTSFNNSIRLTPNLTHVEFGHDFNHSLELVNNLICLIFGNRYEKPLVLTPNLKYLTLGKCFSNILVLNKYLTHCSIKTDFNKHQLILSKHMIKIVLGNFSKCPILTKQLEKCTLLMEIAHSVVLTKNIKYAYFQDLHTIVLNKNITSLTIVVMLNKPTYFNKNIKYFIIYFSYDFKSPVPNLTKNLKMFSTMSYQNEPITYPDYPLECIYVSNYKSHNIIDGLPNNNPSTNISHKYSCENIVFSDKHKIFPNIPNNVTVTREEYNYSYHHSKVKLNYYVITCGTL